MAAFLGKLGELNHIGKRIEQDGVGRGTIASGTTYLLIVALNALWHIVMDNPTHITLVDTHTESNGGTHYLDVVFLEIYLRFVAFLLGKSCVIDSRTYSFTIQKYRDFLCSFPAKTVNDTAFQRTGFDEVQNVVFFLLRRIATFDSQAEIGTVTGARAVVIA